MNTIEMQKREFQNIEEFYEENLRTNKLVDLKNVRKQLEDLSINKQKLAEILAKNGKELGAYKGCMSYSDAADLLDVDLDDFASLKEQFLLYDMQDIDVDPTGKDNTILKDIGTLADKVSLEKVALRWKLPSAGKDDKRQASSGIQKMYPEQRTTVFGLGSETTSLALIKNIKSKFVSSPLEYGESDLKQRLTETIGSIEKERNETLQLKDPKDLALKKKRQAEIRSLTTINFMSDIWSEEDLLQDSEVVDNVKTLAFLKALMCRQALATIKYKTGGVDYAGFIGERYQADKNDKEKEPVVICKFQAVMTLVSPTLEPYDPAVEVAYIANYEPLVFKTLDLSKMSVRDVCKHLRGQNMDITFSIDSCSIKKTGKNYEVMPKLRINQIILREYNEPKSENIGLDLFSFSTEATESDEGSSNSNDCFIE